MGRPGPLPYGRIAGLYDAFLRVFGFRRAVGRFLDRLPLDLPPGSRVVDAGCGTGLLALWVLRRFPGVEVVAFDVDRSMLAVAGRATTRMEGDAGRLALALGDLRSPDRLTRFPDGKPLQLADASCDAVLVGAALEHVPLVSSLRRLQALLKPGGLLLVLGVREGGAGALLGWIYRFRAYRLAQLHEALGAAGFGEIRTERLRPVDFPANLTRIAVLARRQ